MQRDQRTGFLLTIYLFAACTAICSCGSVSDHRNLNNIQRIPEHAHSQRAVRSDSADAFSVEKRIVPSHISESLESGSILLVSLLDGKIAALDQDTGRRIWVHDTGQPLVSNKGVAGLGERDKATIFPGADGSLYAYSHDAHSFEILPETVEDLVDASPMRSGVDGSLVLGSKDTSLLLLDAATGELLEEVSAFGGRIVQIADLLNSARNRYAYSEELTIYNTVLLARSNYHVHGIGRAGAVKWNVTYGRVQQLSVPYLRSGIELPYSTKANPGLLIGPQNSLLCFDARTGLQKWAAAFDVPLVAAYPSGGGQNILSGPLDAIMPSVDLGQIFVGQLSSGELYALPASFYDFDLGSESTAQPCSAGDFSCASTVTQAALVADAGSQDISDPRSPAASIKLGMHEVSAATQVALMLPTSRGFNAFMLPPAREPAPEPSPFQGWTWQGLLFIMVASSSITSILFVSIGVYILRSQTRSQADRSATGGKGLVDDATQMGRATAEQFAEGLGWKATTSESAISSNDNSPTVALDRPTASRNQKKKKKKRVKNGDAAENGSSHHLSEQEQSSVEAERSSRASDVSRVLSSSEHYNSSTTDGLSVISPARLGNALVGRIQVGTQVLGYGSGGTVVLAGELDGRHVAVKRLLARFYDLARKEIDALIEVDDHPNVVRCFALERDSEFVYLALERCQSALADVVESSAAEGGPKLPLLQLVGKDAQPMPIAWSIGQDIGQGLMFLHDQGFVHRDLKPHNVLLNASGRAKVSDMGLCTRLHNDASSFETPGAGGSHGWQAYEQLLKRSGGTARQSKAVDVFSYGLLLHYCLAGGKHPFGARYERDHNILQGRYNLAALKHLPEATNLVAAMLQLESARRPSMTAVMAHPAWWSSDRKLAFLVDISNFVEFQDRQVDQRLLMAFESYGSAAFGESWGGKLTSSLMHELSRFRDYRYTSLRDLLRVVRNKRSHFYEMSEEAQRQLGPLPDGFLRYFTVRFPGLFMACYAFALHHCLESGPLVDFFLPNAGSLMAFFLADNGPGRNQALSPMREDGSSNGIAGMTVVALTAVAASPVKVAAERVPHVAPVDFAARAPRRHNHSSPLGVQQVTVLAMGLPNLSPPTASPLGILPSPGPSALPSASHWGGGRSNPPLVESRSPSFVSGASSAREPDLVSTWSPAMQSSGQGWALGSQPVASSFAQAASHALPALEAVSISASEESGQHPPPNLGTGGDVVGSKVPAEASPARIALMPWKRLASEAESELDDELMASLIPDLGIGLPPSRDSLTTATGAADSPVAGLLHSKGLSLAGSASSDSQAAEENSAQHFPSRAGHPVCDFYQKTGHCKYGEACKFDHPAEFAVSLNKQGLPLRPDEPICGFYSKKGECKFGRSCKFNHPNS